jgi:hypothetical protein
MSIVPSSIQLDQPWQNAFHGDRAMTRTSLLSILSFFAALHGVKVIGFSFSQL